MYQNIPTKVLTGEVRLSYANLNEPRAQKSGDVPKYSATLLIPKTDITTIENIRASIEAAAQDAQGTKWNGYRPPNIFDILHDGDGVKSNGKPYGDECAGHYVLNANSIQKPNVVHQSDIRTQLSPSDIYSGMWARVTINFYGFSVPEKIGVACGLGNVMKTRDDKPFAGGASAESDFEGVGAVVQSQQSFQQQQAFGQPPQSFQSQQAFGQPPQSFQSQQAFGQPPYQNFGRPTSAPGAMINPLTGLPI